jgi:hypothetical protein
LRNFTSCEFSLNSNIKNIVLCANRVLDTVAAQHTANRQAFRLIKNTNSCFTQIDSMQTNSNEKQTQSNLWESDSTFTRFFTPTRLCEDSLHSLYGHTAGSKPQSIKRNFEIVKRTSQLFKLLLNFIVSYRRHVLLIKVLILLCIVIVGTIHHCTAINLWYVIF